MQCNNGCQIPLAGALYCHHCHQREVEEAYLRGKRAGMLQMREIVRKQIGRWEKWQTLNAKLVRGALIILRAMEYDIRFAIPDVAIEEA